MRFLYTLISTVLFFLYGITASANTVLGGNITWTCLGGDQYRIRLTSYLDCYGYDLSGGIPMNETVFLIPENCGSFAFSADLSYVSNTQISDLCPSEMAFSSCSGGANQGVMQFVYEGVVTLPAGCQWNVIWSNLYWGYFDNSNEFANPSYIHSVINTNYPCYSSPVIVSTPAAPQVPYLCAGIQENHQVVLSGLPAGWTVSYQIVENLVMGTDVFSPPVASNGWTDPGFGTPTPPSGSGGTQISWTPTLANLTTNGFRLQINIYDDLGNLVGVINENMVFYVRNCTQTDTHFTTPSPVTAVGAETTLTGTNNISVCAGDSLIFTVSALNSNPLRAITITSNPPTGLPLVATQVGNNQANKTYKLLTTGAHVGSYTLNIHAEDDACPNPDTDDTTINITVHPNVQFAFTDTTICAGNNVTLIAQGLSNPNNYTWSVTSGDTGLTFTSNSATQTISPDSTTVVSVSGTGIPASCQTSDNVTVHVLMRGLTYTKTDETCGNNNGTIDLTVLGETTSNITYTWLPALPSTQDQSSLNGGTTYTVTVTDTVYSCTLTQAIAIGDVPAPVVVFSGDTTICAGGTATLHLNLTSGSAPFTVTGTNLPGSASPAPTATHSFTVSPTSTTTYTVTGVTDNSNCSATTNQTVTVTVRPVVTASFAPVSAICAGSNLNLNVTFSQAGNYQLAYEVTPAIPGSPVTIPSISSGAVPAVSVITPTTANIYSYNITSVQYTTAPFCPSTDAANPAINVTVNPSPTATLTGGGATLCAGSCHNLTITLTGTGPWTVGYTLNNVAQTPIVIPANQSSYTWNVCPAATSTYCITSVQDANCTSTVSNQCATLTVVPYPTFASYTLNQTDICAGGNATMTVNFGPAGYNACLYFTATPSNSDPGFTPPFCSQPSASAFTSNLTPNATTVYCLDSIYFENAPQCATPVSICRTLNVNGNITVVPTDTVCNNIGTQYQVVYTLSGGVAPFSEAPAVPNGTFNGNTFTTDWVNNGSASWSFTDVHACNTVTMSTNYTCPVLTAVGTMNATPINVCGSGQATGIYNNTGEFLDGNDELMFILYTNASNVLGSIIQTNCTAPEFSFNALLPMTYGTTYYIAAVAGDEGTTGCVNTSAANVRVSNGTPVVWYETPTATLSAPGSTSACAGSCVTLNIARTGQGPWTVQYTVDGSPGSQSPITISANAPVPFTFCSNQDGVHVLTSVSSGVGAGQCVGTVSGTVDVTINPLPTAVLTGTPSTCAGDDYCFSINLTGTAPWSIEIDTPLSTNASESNILASPYTGYCAGLAGSYQIISVTDANNCTNTVASSAVTLTVNPLPVVHWVQSDTSFCEGSSIQLQYAISGGATAPFAIDFNTLPDITNPLATGSVTVNTAGDYEIVTVTDAHNCESANGATVHVDEILTPIVNAGPDLDQCVGLPIIIGTPLVTGQTYSWTSPNGLPPSPSNIAEPTVTLSTVPVSNPIEYIVTTYSAQCFAKDTMLLTIHGLPAITVTAVSDSVCFAGCTNLEVSGSGTLTYEWTPSSSITTIDLTSGVVEACPTSNETFEVTAYQVHGNATCERTQNISIVVGTEMTVAENFTAQVCFGTCTGAITLAASGGFTPYHFAPTGDITGWTTSNLCPGTYDYTVIDATGCTFSGSIVIEERPQEVIDDITITQPTCAYDLGTIQVNNVYTSYSIAGCSYTPAPSSATTGLFQNVPPCATVYTITATFAVSQTESCSTTTTVSIQPLSSDITFNADWVNEVFCYDTQACFDATPTGGSGAFDVYWYSCPNLTNNCQVSAAHPYCIPMQADHTYYGVAVDALGCRSDTVIVAAHLAPEILLDVQNGLSTTAICEGDCINLVASVSGGNNNATVSWFQTPAVSVGAGSPVNVCPLVTTTYYAIANDGCSQQKTDTLVVVVHDTPVVLFDADVYQGCYPQTINFVDLSESITDNHTCVWNFGAGANQSVCGDVTFTYPNYGEFHPTYTITTEYGCVGTYTLPVPIIIYGKPQVDFTWEPQPVTVIDNRVQFINQSFAAVSYNWTVQGVGASVEQNPEFILPPRDQSSYYVCLEATTVNGCKDTLCQDVFMETVMQVFVPNAFTPDPDSDNNINDEFLPIITGHDPNRYKLWIMNRWGDTVFYSTDHTQAWTGNFDGGDHFVPNGVYIWHIECYEMGSNDLEVYQGTVTIIR